MSDLHPNALKRRSPLWWRFAGLIIRPRLARALARIALDGYLHDTGWLSSVRSGEIADRSGRPIPWATYPFISFLEPRIKKEWGVFEYGSGASTRYLAERVSRVVAIEHDPAFAEKLAAMLPANAEVVFRPENTDGYVRAIADSERTWHIVVIDGRQRENCARAALERLASDGVIVFDDTERTQYTAALEHIVASGFRRLDFWGISAGCELHRCTSVFYRPGNVLGI
jgi:hypothetical protein